LTKHILHHNELKCKRKKWSSLYYLFLAVTRSQTLFAVPLVVGVKPLLVLGERVAGAETDQVRLADRICLPSFQL